MSVNKTSQAREQILGRIRKALSREQLPMPYPEMDKWQTDSAFYRGDLAMDELFAQNFVGLGGKFVYCEHQQELLEQLTALYEALGWNKLFCTDRELLTIARNNHLDYIQAADNSDAEADACITDCEALIARTGSFLMSSRQHLGRVSTILYPVHIVVAYRSHLVYDIDDAFLQLQSRYKDALPSMISIQTGPSRTADIEKTLVTGVHGPKEVFCFYVNV